MAPHSHCPIPWGPSTLIGTEIRVLESLHNCIFSWRRPGARTARAVRQTAGIDSKRDVTKVVGQLVKPKKKDFVSLYQKSTVT